MRKLLLSAFVLATTVRVFGQGQFGQVYVDNTANANPSCMATANGLFFFSEFSGSGDNATPPVPIMQDFNLNFYGGTDSANLTLLKTFVGPAAAGDNAGPGLFSDPSGTAVIVPGATTTAFFRIEAWLGGAGSTWFSASIRNSFASANTIFSNPVSTPPNLPPTLTGMPAVVIFPFAVCPEPSALALVSLGAAFMFFLWRKWLRS